MKNFLGLRKITVRELTVLGMLTAITVILAIFCTFRIGNAIKIPIKFITVFITASIFGPIWGGIVGALGDVLNSFLVPVGAPIPLITLIEFIYGFIFGLFFYNNSKNYFIKTVICSAILSIIDILAVSLILTYVGYFSLFSVAVAVRLPVTIIKFAIYIIVILLFKNKLNFIGRLIKK